MEMKPRISFEEREKITIQYAQESAHREIAKELKRNPNTI